MIPLFMIVEWYERGREILRAMLPTGMTDRRYYERSVVCRNSIYRHFMGEPGFQLYREACKTRSEVDEYRVPCFIMVTRDLPREEGSARCKEQPFGRHGVELGSLELSDETSVDATYLEPPTTMVCQYTDSFISMSRPPWIL